MDALQTARMIEWLDQERRRDKSTIALLEERLQQQQEQMEQLRRQLSGLENEQSSIRTQYISKDREQELLEGLRKEVSGMIEGVEAKRLTAEREAERRQEVAREALVTPLRQLEERVDDLGDNLKEISAIRVEHERMGNAIAALTQRIEELGKKTEEPERRIVFLEEQRRQDNRRLSDVQSSLPELQKSIDQLRPRIDLIEGLVRNNEKRVIDLQNEEGSRREEIQQFLDQQVLLGQQREQQLSEITKQVGNYDSEMRRNMERFENWSETHRQMKKVVEDFERIGERLERRINEVAEMQRLSEERFRSEWNDWASDDQIRWKEFTVSHDEAWRVHDKEVKDLRESIRSTAQALEPLRNSLERMWKLQRAQTQLYRESYQALLLEYDKPEEKTTTSTMPALSFNGDAQPRINGGNGNTNGSSTS